MDNLKQEQVVTEPVIEQPLHGQYVGGQEEKPELNKKRLYILLGLLGLSVLFTGFMFYRTKVGDRVHQTLKTMPLASEDLNKQMDSLLKTYKYCFQVNTAISKKPIDAGCLDGLRQISDLTFQLTEAMEKDADAIKKIQDKNGWAMRTSDKKLSERNYNVAYSTEAADFNYERANAIALLVKFYELKEYFEDLLAGQTGKTVRLLGEAKTKWTQMENLQEEINREMIILEEKKRAYEDFMEAHNYQPENF